MAKQRAQPTPRMTRKDFFFGTSPDLPKVVELALARIHSNPEQPRKAFDENSLRELAASIERHGLLQPVTVQKAGDGDGYLLVAGERRYRAHRLLGRETIAAIVTRGNPDELALIENVQREDLGPLEEAEALCRMMARHGYTQEELAAVVGKARPTVTKLLKLNGLPEQIKAECATSHISKSVLLEIAHLPSAEEQLALWERVKDGTATVRTAREKKDQATPSPAPSALARTIASGRSFMQRMRRLPPRTVVDDRTQYDELLQLKRELDELIATYERARTDATE